MNRLSSIQLKQPHRLMQQAVSDGVFPGAVLLVEQGGAVRHFEAYGLADSESGELATTDTVFDLASLTKPLATTLCVMKLMADNHFSLETRLGELLPETRGTDKVDLSIEQLLRHTSGLPAYRPFFKSLAGISFSRARSLLTELLLQEPLADRPGVRTAYSDLGFMALRMVIEAVSNKRMDAFLYTDIYRPLGIEKLFYIDLETDAAVAGSVAATSRCPWRGRMIKGEVEDENAWAVGGIDGHAGLFGTAGELRSILAVLTAVYHGRGRTDLFPRALVRQFLRVDGKSQRTPGFDIPSPFDSSAGKYFSKSTVGHLGYTGTSFWMDLSAGVIIILLTNRVHPSRKNERIREFRPFIHDSILVSLQGKRAASKQAGNHRSDEMPQPPCSE